MSERRHLGTGNWGVGPALAGIMVLLAILVLLAGAGIPAPPKLVVDKSVGADLELLARETWDRFVSTFWARRNCFGDVKLHAAYALDSRAGYDPDTATATVRVPGTAAMLQSGLVHEWAHHVEFQCQAHRVLRTAFLAAQGLPASTPWRPGDTSTDISADQWANIPSEQYAEAVVELVQGGRPVPTGARVSPAAVRVVGGWAAGGSPAAALEAGGE